MKNNYMVGAYNTGGHLVTMIICMQFKDVRYLDSAKKHLAWKFQDIRAVVDWSLSCRLCSQKFNLLVFLIGIADHAGVLIKAQRTKW
jgi:hypothetical protein